MRVSLLKGEDENGSIDREAVDGSSVSVSSSGGRRSGAVIPECYVNQTKSIFVAGSPSTLEWEPGRGEALESSGFCKNRSRRALFFTCRPFRRRSSLWGAGPADFIFIETWYSMTKILSRRMCGAFVALLAFGFVSAGARAQTPAQAAPATLAVVTPVTSCQALAGVALDDIGGAGSRVISARESRHEGVAVCALEGRLAPGIGFSLRLPTRSWAQRYLQVGCGGLCGRASLQVGAADSCVPLTAGGFVIAATDMGHQGMGGEFGRDPALRADFAYRAQHLTALASKKLIRAFYGRGEAFSYFTGCSDGGREALVEAQRFPDDFDGIIAGAAAMNFQVQNAIYHAWQARSNTGADGKAIVLAAQLPLLHRAVMASCAGGDGLIADPRTCHFDPGVLLCKTAAESASGGCLSAPQVAAVRRLYEGPRDPKTGVRLTVGGPQAGSELAWAGVFVPADAKQPLFSSLIALGALRNLSFAVNPPAGFELADVTFDLAGFDRLRALHPLYDATNPDLTAFAAKGHKLILWHGWADQHISPLNTIAYHTALRRFMGAQRSASFERLYLLPGVYHCGGGEGPSAVDFLTPMMAWVEAGIAPQAVVTRQATQSSEFGQPTSAPPAAAGAAPAGAAVTAVTAARTRPVYPYPYLAAYAGHGDPDRASSYVRADPIVEDDATPWAGEDFYRPYAALTR